MRLISLKYSQWDQGGNNWSIEDFSCAKINLIVGQNSIGKSRTINVINGLSSMLIGKEIKIGYAQYKAYFKDQEDLIEYLLEYDNYKIVKETLKIGDTFFLEREEDGIGSIYADQLKQQIKFQVPDTSIASVVKRDSIQHPFLQRLYNWGESTRLYRFGTSLGKENLAIFKETPPSEEERRKIDVRNTSNVVVFLKQAIKDFGDSFVSSILDDINRLGYNLTDIGVAPIVNSVISTPMLDVPEGIYIKEAEHDHIVEQIEISQGLFRSLSLFIQLRFSERYSQPSLILIDDIGEGLDYERSTKLIQNIIDIAESENIQLIMTTNDRFVMNNVSLEYWSVMKREGSCCHFINSKDHKELFDDFDLTGLSNFDFFTSKYYNK
ncbi:MAG: AAA family ATPase [Candidatus Electrothrix sp. Rat3]|nr:AAA family ATPase [Candidatus Electrothrix rattekaaiensis]